MNPIQFSTQFFDEDTGLVNYGFRYYDPSQGRFLNRDPIGEQGGANLYRFVGNDPVHNVDKWGLAWVTDPNCGPWHEENYWQVRDIDDDGDVEWELVTYAYQEGCLVWVEEGTGSDPKERVTGGGGGNNGSSSGGGNADPAQKKPEENCSKKTNLDYQGHRGEKHFSYNLFELTYDGGDIQIHSDRLFSKISSIAKFYERDIESFYYCIISPFG